MVATKAKYGRCLENEQPHAPHKRRCTKNALSTGCGVNWQPNIPDPAAEFLQQFNLAQGGSSPDQPCNELVWRCWAEFNVLMRDHSGQLRDIPLCGYASLTRADKQAVFSKLLGLEGLGHPGQPWPTHVHVIASILQRFFHQFPEASLCRYTLKRPEWSGEWCAKWNLQPGSDITVYTCNAYDGAYEPLHVSVDMYPDSDLDRVRLHVHGGELQAPVEHLSRTLFVPVLGF